MDYDFFFYVFTKNNSRLLLYFIGCNFACFSLGNSYKIVKPGEHEIDQYNFGYYIFQLDK